MSYLQRQSLIKLARELVDLIRFQLMQVKAMKKRGKEART